MKKSLLGNLLILLSLISGFNAAAQNYVLSNGTYNTCSGTFYDAGGTGNYNNNENFTQTFCATNGGNMNVVFNSFAIENYYDSLYIFNGPTINSPLIGTYTGSTSPGTITSAGSCLTFRFKSDVSVVLSGWDATISCTAPVVPVVDFTASTTTGCAPLSVFFSNTSTGCTNYYWEFGDGNYSYSQSPSNVYTGNGANYNVTLYAYDVFWNFLGSKTIQINTAYSNNYFYVSNNPSCPNSNIYFQYYDAATSYNWNFGDGNTSTQQYPSHSYASNGSYNVTLSVSGGACPQTISQVVNVNNTVPADASFNYYFSSGSSCPGSPVSFNSYNQGTSYLWDFGDGNTSTTQYAQHAYAVAGNYTVSLTLTNACGNTNTQTNMVNINNTSTFPTTLAINNNGVICPGSTASFNTDYGYQQYVWNFGDGTPSVTVNGPYMEHTYLLAGNYNVGVTITDYCGNSTTVTTTYTVSNNAPVTNVNLNFPPQSCPNSTVYFNTSYGYDNYTWNFGDGSPSVNLGSNASHSFATTGIYTVSVTITNSCGNDTTISGSVNINNNVPMSSNSNLNAYPNNLCPNQTVSFNGPYDASNYQWSFGDGSPSLTTTLGYGVSHNYTTPGNYTATVTATNACGADTTVSANIVVSSNNYVDTYVNIGMNKSTYCPNEPVHIYLPYGFTANVVNYGDGSATDSLVGQQNTSATHQYTTPGSYTISVRVINACGNDTVIYKNVSISNNAAMTQPYFNVSPAVLCPGGGTHFDTGGEFVTYSWNFGDGFTSNGASHANHTYTTAGNYTPTLTVTDYCGADSTFNLPVVMVSASAPVSNNIYMNISPYNSCPNDLITFSINSGYASYIWNYGDGTIDTTSSSSITHSYAAAGNYNISVRVTNQCGNFKIVYNTVTVSNTNTLPDLQIRTNSSSYCPNDNVNFDISLLYFNGGGNGDFSSNYTYSWNFGDGQTATTYGIGTTHQYSANGTYNVTATITNACGSTVTLTKTIVINNSAVSGESFFESGGQTALYCPGDVVVFVYGGSSNNNVVNFGDGTSGTMTEQIINPEGHPFYIIKHAYNNTGQYNVHIASTNGCGNVSYDSVSVSVGNNNLPVQGGLFVAASASGILTTCRPVTFIGIGGASYAWDFGDGQTSTSSSPIVNHVYSNAGSYLVTCVVTNGCGNSATYTENVIITGGVGITASVSSSTAVTCNGGSNGTATASASGGESPYTYTWSNGQTGSVISGVPAGAYTVSVTDAAGCIGTTTANITEPAAISINVATTGTSCSSNTGTASVSSVTGANAPYLYLWSTNATSSSISGLAAGSYTVRVTGSNGCQNTQSFAISATGAATVSLNAATNVSCYGGTNGAINVNVTGGTSPYTYHWSNDSTTQDLSGLAAGTYTLTVTDAGGCISVYSKTITQPSQIAVNVTVTRQADCGQFNGIATAAASGGTSPYTYAWAALGNNATQGGLPAGTYSVTATDATGCASSQQVTVNNANAPIVTGTVTNVTCNGSANGVISLSTTGGTGPYLYTWMNNGSHSFTQSNLAPATYTVRVVDATQCEVFNQFTITQPQVLTASITATSANCGHTNGMISSTVTGGTTPYTYNWSNGQSTPNISNLGAAAYTLNVTDSKGCTASANATVAVGAPAQQVCVVTVDQAINKNVIVWEKTAGQGVSAYNIFKESNVAGVYNLLVQMPYDSVSEYVDMASFPDQRSYRYKIQAVDSCGNSGAMSPAHKTIHLNVNLGVPQTNVNLIWEVYEGFNYGSYIIWRGQGLNTLAQLDTVPSSILSYTDVNAPTGADSLYYFVEMVSPSSCTSAMKTMAGRNYNSGKSNTSGLRYSNPTALVNTTVNSSLYLYPNPNDGKFTLDLSLTEKQQIEVVIVDLRGRVVRVENLGNLDKGRYVNSMDLSGMAKGVYMLQINTKQGVINNKVVIE